VLVHVFGAVISLWGLDKDLSWIGAGVAWAIAGYLYWKKRRKEERRRAEREARKGSDIEVLVPKNEAGSEEYGAVVGLEAAASDDSSGSSSADENDGIFVGSTATPLTVVSLTFLGALDELTYFPTLLIGGTFSGVDLSLGALITCVAIVLIIVTVLGFFRPILEWMDSIPLYMIVGVFATFLTVEAVWERITG